MLTLFLILAFIFIILIACVPTEKNSKDVAANSYEEWGKRTLLALGIFALIFFPIASAKYNREKMDYSVTGFTVSSTYSFITVYWNAENKTKSDQVVSPIVSAYQNKVMLKRLDASQDVVTLAPDGKYNGMSSFELLNSSSPVEIKITQEKRPDYLVEMQFDLQDA